MAPWYIYISCLERAARCGSGRDSVRGSVGAMNVELWRPDGLATVQSGRKQAQSRVCTPGLNDMSPLRHIFIPLLNSHFHRISGLPIQRGCLACCCSYTYCLHLFSAHIAVYIAIYRLFRSAVIPPFLVQDKVDNISFSQYKCTKQIRIVYDIIRTDVRCACTCTVAMSSHRGLC